MKADKVSCLIVPDDCDRLMTLEEAAARLQVSNQAIRKIMEKRAIIPILKGKFRFISKSALNRFIAELDDGKWSLDNLLELETVR